MAENVTCRMRWEEECFPKGCRGRIMMRIMEEQLEYDAARLLVPDLEEQTHGVLMKMARGEASCGETQAAYNRRISIQRKQARIREMQRSKVPIKEIARRMGMTVKGVRHYMKLQ